MIWIDAKQWIKTGIAFVHGVQQISTVVTHSYSDWSVVSMANPPDFLYMKLLRKADFVEISYSFDGKTYTLLRLAFFPSDTPVRIGLMAAAPDGERFQVIFEDFTVVAV